MLTNLIKSIFFYRKLEFIVRLILPTLAQCKDGNFLFQ